MTTVQVILLVEDDDDDAELTIRALKESKIANTVVRVCDGVEALDYLLGRSAYAGRDVGDIPAVVLLDLNLPRLNGFEVLKAVRADERVRCLPVVILTASNEDKDRLAAYEGHANSFVRKPVNYDEFVLAAKQLGLYWLVLNEPPPRRPPSAP